MIFLVLVLALLGLSTPPAQAQLPSELPPAPLQTASLPPAPSPSAVRLSQPSLAGMFPFALPPFDSSKTATDVSWLNPTRAGANGFVRVEGERFVDGQGKVLRLWGVNLNFAGCFPPKDQAPLIAARLAKFGFNAARMHHFEGYAAPNGIWKGAIGSSKPVLPREFDPVQLDRFDFFISELLKRGIYLDLNLHVGRKAGEGEVPDANLLPDKDKGVDQFDERLQELQNDFSRRLLNHVNPYTGRALKDEPGLAAIEADNENSLLSMWLDGGFSKWPAATTQQLRGKWNDWLKARYSEETLRAAWAEINNPLGPVDLFALPLPFNILNPNAPDSLIPVAMQSLSRMQLATVSGAQGTLELDKEGGPPVAGYFRPGVRANLQKTGSVSWAFQINRDGLDLKESQPYTLTFSARANPPRRISINLWQDRQPNAFEGFTGYADLTPEWQKFSFVFRPANADPQHSRLSWNLNNQTGLVQLGEIALREGGKVAAPEWWTLANGIPPIEFKTTQVARARRDFAEFLGGLEAQNALKTRRFLRDLGVKSLIWQTQAQFGGWGGLWREVAAQSDAIDVHAYWKHPELGSAGWNGQTWRVENASMTASPGTDPLSAFSFARVQGKPFVVSEWNSGQPNDFGGESLLMAAAWAAWQDWAGVFLFDYHSNGNYNRDHFENFFSIDSQPVKMATAPAAALLFRRTPGKEGGNEGKAALLPISSTAPPFYPSTPPPPPGDLTPAWDETTLTISPDWIWPEVANSPGTPTAAPFIKTWTSAGVSRGASLLGRTAIRFDEAAFPTPSRSSQSGGKEFLSDTREIRWSGANNAFLTDAPRSKVAAGFLGGKAVDLGTLRLQMPPSPNNFAVFALSSLDGAEIPQAKRLLLTVVGRAENAGMTWNADRSSVGANWGSGPTLVEGIGANIRLLTDASKLRVWALDETGARRIEVPSTVQNGALSFSIAPAWKTLWYEIAAE